MKSIRNDSNELHCAMHKKNQISNKNINDAMRIDDEETNGVTPTHIRSIFFF